MGWFVKMAGKVPGGKMVVGETFGRAQACFSMWSTVFKDLMWQSSGKRWIKAGQGAEFARYLDRLTGMMSFNQLGMPANASSFLAGWVSFAPQYRFSVLSWFSYLFKGGMIGTEARKDLAKMVAGAVISYTAFCKVTDNPVYLNPYKDGKKFMSINVGGHWIGIGAAVVSMIRAFVDITASALSIDENEPMDFLTLDKWKNPLMRAWFMQSAVLPRLIMEIGERRDFLGYPLESPEDWAMWAGEQITPIWLQDILFDKSGVPVTPISVLGNFAGLRTSPENRWESLNDRILGLGALDSVSDLTDEQSEKINKGETVLSVLDKYQKAELFNAFPELQEVWEASAADALKRSTQVRKNYEDSVTNIRADAMEDLRKAMDIGVKIEGENTRYLRESYNDIMKIYGAKNEQVRDNPDYQDMFAEWEESIEKGKPDAEVFDLAYWEYIDEVVSPDFELPDGQYDYDAYKEALANWREKWGEDYYGKLLYVLENKRGDFPEWAFKLWKDRLALNEGGYWELLPKSVLDMTEELWAESDRKAKFPHFYDLWFRYQNLLTAEQRDEFIEEHPELTKDWRADYRKSHPEDDARLALWGYGGSLQSREAYELVYQWGRELGIPLKQIGRGLPPENLLDQYFEYAEVAREHGGGSLEAKWYREEHPDFEAWGVENWGWKPITEQEVIPKEVYELYQEYQKLEKGKPRLVFRHEHPELEAWLVEVKGYAPVGDRWKD